jgi:hypothetical protein
VFTSFKSLSFQKDFNLFLDFANQGKTCKNEKLGFIEIYKFYQKGGFKL